MTRNGIMEELREGNFSRIALNDTMGEAIEMAFLALALLEQGQTERAQEHLYRWLFKNADVLEPLMKRHIWELLVTICVNRAYENGTLLTIEAECEK